ncbi:hypothetical protein NC653_026702 [Populus alba x Populus x berolinensis]|uniref:Uncharacterized protein n=1 Tax=Populus alba x Populus x berolinensis TaxID=444605 RepID=A0AAD6M465_9ROSI|nr:hypothetical protein NC653_026702 [Populus alba x Populus x berolinensis]
MEKHTEWRPKFHTCKYNRSFKVFVIPVRSSVLGV